MKLSEITDKTTGSFVVDMMLHYLEQGKKLYADIDGDMGTMPFYGEIEEVRPGPTWSGWRHHLGRQRLHPGQGLRGHHQR